MIIMAYSSGNGRAAYYVFAFTAGLTVAYTGYVINEARKEELANVRAKKQAIVQNYTPSEPAAPIEPAAEQPSQPAQADGQAGQEYHIATDMVDEIVTSPNKYNIMGNFSQEDFRQLADRFGNSVAFGYLMAESGVDTKNRESVQNYFDSFGKSSGILPGTPDIEEQMTVAAARRLALTKPGAIAKVLAQIYHDETAESVWKDTMKRRSEWDPWVKGYMDQHDDNPPPYADFKHAEFSGTRWIAAPAGPNTPWYQGNVVGVQKEENAHGSTERTIIDAAGTNVQQQRQDLSVQGSIQDYNDRTRDRGQDMQQMKKDAEKFVGRGMNAVKDTAGKMINSLPKPQPNQRSNPQQQRQSSSSQSKKKK
jgi:hypothetical protein